MKKSLVYLFITFFVTSSVVAEEKYDNAADDAIINAYHAYRKQQNKVLLAAVNKLNHDPLSDYVNDWYLTNQIAQSIDSNLIDEVHHFKEQFPQSPLYESLRNTLLYTLYNNHQNDLFLKELIEKDHGNLNLYCAKLSLTLDEHGPTELLTKAKALWLANPENHFCTQLVFPLMKLNLITEEELWQELFLALHEHHDNRAHALNDSLPSEKQIRERDWREAQLRPKHFLDYALRHHARDSAHQLLMLHALDLFASDDSDEAAQWWQNHPQAVSSAWYELGWAEIAYQGALTLNPQSLTWFEKAKKGMNEDAYRAWHVRIALRQSQWQKVSDIIQAMPVKQAKARIWQYWHAQALIHLQQIDKGQALLNELSGQSDFYGLLAQEQIGLKPPSAPSHTPIKPTEVTELNPRFQRALRLHRLQLKPLDRQEWNYANQGLSPREHLIAAQLAANYDWLDRSIYSANQAGPFEDMTLSYPIPFEQTMKENTSKRSLDEAWVYGLIRQESQFATQALSRTGAQGLMQIMPMTARWIAKHLSLKRFLPEQTNELETNLNLGTYYLQHLLSQLGTPTLATAGYNAGPRRVKQWLANNPMDGVIFIETIPFNETRDYVKKVMTNTVLYAQRLNQPYIPLKERIGNVPSVSLLHQIGQGEP